MEYSGGRAARGPPTWAAQPSTGVGNVMDTQYFSDPHLAELHGAGAALAKSAFLDVDLKVPADKEKLLSIFESLAPIGYLGSTVAKDQGGAGLTNLEFGALLEGVAEVAPFLSNHSVQRAIAAVGTDAVKKRWLQPLLRGEAIGTVAVTEPHGGSQVADIRTTLEEDGDGFKLTGQKIWAVHNMYADVASVLAAGPGGDPVRVIVDLNHDSVRRQQIPMAGLKYLTFGLLEFIGTPVAADDILIGQGLDAAKKSFAVARSLVAVQATSIGQRAVYNAAKHLSTRNVRGRVATTTDLIRRDIGRMSSRIEAARFMAYHALRTIDSGDLGADAFASGAKAHATDTALDVCTEAIELCAAEGLIAGSEIQRIRDDAAMLAIADGTSIVNHAIWGSYVIAQSQIRGIH